MGRDAGLPQVGDGAGSGWPSVGLSGPGGRPGSSSGGIFPALGWKLFIDAHALTSVPSTEKCSSDSRGATSRWARIAAITLRDISVVSSRSRYLLKTVGTRTGSSIPRPTNQRNNRHTASVPSVAARSGARTGSGSGWCGSGVPAGSRGGRNRCKAPRTRLPGSQAPRSPPVGPCATDAARGCEP